MQDRQQVKVFKALPQGVHTGLHRQFGSINVPHVSPCKRIALRKRGMQI